MRGKVELAHNYRVVWIPERLADATESANAEPIDDEVVEDISDQDQTEGGDASN